ncbi:Uncharacterised protein [Vibrio cholerae]|nr:Uncharacterised protein [Vibrio cholerae]
MRKRRSVRSLRLPITFVSSLVIICCESLCAKSLSIDLGMSLVSTYFQLRILR